MLLPNENGLMSPASTRTACPATTAGRERARSRASASSCTSRRASSTAAPVAYKATPTAAQSIGGATRLPFVWVLLGILGGIETVGLIGLVLGPALMAAVLLLWREWTGQVAGPLNPAIQPAI